MFSGPYQKRYGTFSVPDLKSYNVRDMPHLYPQITQVEDSHSLPTSPVSAEAGSSLKTSDVEQNTLPPCIKKTKVLRSFSSDRIASYLDEVEKSRIERTIHFGRSSDDRNRLSKDNLDRTDYTNFEDKENSCSSMSSVGLTMNDQPSLPQAIPTLQASSHKTASISSKTTDAKENVSSFPSFQPTPPVKHLVERLVSFFSLRSVYYLTGL